MVATAEKVTQENFPAFRADDWNANRVAYEARLTELKAKQNLTPAERREVLNLESKKSAASK